jgi:hypothetical protein
VVVSIALCLSGELCLPDPTYLCDVVVYDLLVGHIALVAHEELVHALRGVTVDFLQPLLDVVEAVHVGNIVDNANTVSAAVVRAGDCAEALLSSCVPLSFAPPSVLCPRIPVF